MRVLLDTNILVRSHEPAGKEYKTAVDAGATLRGQGHDLCLVPQNLYEFWVVSTRPRPGTAGARPPTKSRPSSRS